MKSNDFSSSDYKAAGDVIRAATKHRPTIALILGSGLGGIVDAIQNADVLPYESIPLWPRSTAIGHAGRLVIGTLEGKTVMALQGRVHFYEGYSMQEVTFPVRVMQEMGIKTLIVTNAAGGINTGFESGDVMLINDHMAFPGMSGQNPLVGPNDEALGTRFPDMASAYDRELRATAHAVAKQAGFTLRDGIFASLSGPNFETPAEIRMLRILGADAVGMSTAPEVIVARHAGIRVVGLSGISNIAIDTTETDLKATHQEVLNVIGRLVVPKMTTLVRGIVASVNA